MGRDGSCGFLTFHHQRFTLVLFTVGRFHSKKYGAAKKKNEDKFNGENMWVTRT